MLKVSAPGKLFLFGEYAVLGGAWCVVSAVDRRVLASRREAGTGYELLGARFADEEALPRAVVSQQARPGVGVEHLGADIRALYDAQSAEKLGLGSSAASAVALSGAYLLEDDHSRPFAINTRVNADENTDENSIDRSHIDQIDRIAIFEHAFSAHRRLQDGRGSGADIAASVFGGTIAYRLIKPMKSFGPLELSISNKTSDSNEATSHGVEKSPNGPRPEPPSTIKTAFAEIIPDLCLPEDLQIVPIWLGRPASSPGFMRRCEAAIAQNPDAMRTVLEDVAGIGEEALEICVADRAIAASASKNPKASLDSKESQALAFCRLVERADLAMEALGKIIEAPIISDAHRRLRAYARSFGIALKPSGAGGGDFSLAVAPRSADWPRFLGSLPEDLRAMPLELGAPGLLINRVF